MQALTIGREDVAVTCEPSDCPPITTPVFPMLLCMLRYLTCNPISGIGELAYRFPVRRAHQHLQFKETIQAVGMKLI